MRISVDRHFCRLVVMGDGSNRVGREVDGSLTLLVPNFDGILIREFRDAVSNTATGD